MSNQRDMQETGYFDRVNTDLMRSLRRCHALVDDCRDKLVAANSNEPEFMLAGDQANAKIEDERVG